MKVKFFYDDDYTRDSIKKIQDEINDFIQNKEVIDIKLTSEGASNGHSYMVMVVYS